MRDWCIDSPKSWKLFWLNFLYFLVLVAMKTDIMRIQLIFLGLVCWLTAGHEIHPDEITTEWLTTDVPTTVAPDAITSGRPLHLDSRARILLNAELEEDPSMLVASQTSIPSAGSSTQLDNSLRSTNNNDWTPIAWPSTRLVSATPLAFPPPSSPPPVSVRPAPGPSTLVIRPTPLLRPLPTIVAAPARVSSTQRTVPTTTTGVRQSSTENTPTLTRPPVSSRPVVHFDLADASSGPKFTVVADQSAADSSISPSAPVPALATTVVAAASNHTVQPNVVAHNTTTVSIELEAIANATNATDQMEIAIEEFMESLNETIRLSVDNETLNETSSDNAKEEKVLFPSTHHDSTTGLVNSSFVTHPSHTNDTVTEDELFEQEFLTTPLEENPMTTDLSTGPNNDSVVEFSSSSSAFDEGNNSSTVLVLPTETAVPSTSHKAAISVTTTSVPVTTVTSQPSHVESTSMGQERGAASNGNREDSGRSTTTTLSVLSGLSTIFPALTRPPSTTILPTEISKPITTTTTTTTTTAPPSTTASIVFPTSAVWTVAPQPAPPTPSVPHSVQGTGWPTTTHQPSTHHDPSIPFFAHPTSTEYYPEWPSTEGSSVPMDSNTATIVAVSVSIALILVIAIVVLLLLVLRRRRARAVQGTCQPARMDAYSLDNVSQSNTWQRGKVRNSLRASKRSYLNQAFDDSV